MQNQTEQDNLFQWMGSNRLFERYVFFYFLIISGFVMIGGYTLGFELDGFSAGWSVFMNVLWVFVLTLCIWFTPFWFRITLGWCTDVLKDTRAINQQLDELDDESREVAEKHLAHNGKLPITKLQFAAMVFIGWYFTLEVCIVTSFVRDFQLIWEPQWIQSLIGWGIDQTRTPADYRLSGVPIEIFDVDFKVFDLLETPPFSDMKFSDEMSFLQSPLGHTVLFFALWRLFMVVPVLIAFYIAFGKLLGWLGLNGLNIYYAKSVVDFFGRALLNVLISIFLIMPWYLITISTTAESMLSLEWWTDQLSMNFVMYIFSLIGYTLLGGWFATVYRFFRKTMMNHN